MFCFIWVEGPTKLFFLHFLFFFCNWIRWVIVQFDLQCIHRITLRIRYISNIDLFNFTDCEKFRALDLNVIAISLYDVQNDESLRGRGTYMRERSETEIRKWE